VREICLGSMLWSRFSAIFNNFSATKIGIFLENQCCDEISSQISSVLCQSFLPKIFWKS
jgi:hypothetical protein